MGGCAMLLGLLPLVSTVSMPSSFAADSQHFMISDTIVDDWSCMGGALLACAAAEAAPASGGRTRAPLRLPLEPLLRTRTQRRGVGDVCAARTAQ